MATPIPPSIRAALDQANVLWPGRRKASDGVPPNAEHLRRKSDHNPDARGVYHAFDLTHDPAHGVDCEQLAAHLIAADDARVKYIIWNRRIAVAPGWAWGPYDKHPHTTHMHVSIKGDPVAENDTSPWWPIGEPGLPSADQNTTGPKLLLLPLGTGPTSAPAPVAGVPPAPGGPAPPAVGPDEFVGPPPLSPAPAPAGPVAPEPMLPAGGPPPKGQVRPLPAGYKRLTRVSKAVAARALQVLHRTNYPIGTFFLEAVEGKEYLFALEWHKHAATDNVSDKLKDWHRGVTVCDRK